MFSEEIQRLINSEVMQKYTFINTQFNVNFRWLLVI